MCVCIDRDVASLSVHEEAEREAERHKWIESQKQGRDLGSGAIHEWYRVHWPDYCRHKRIEHLQGRRLWREFGTDDFGRLETEVVSDNPLFDRILDRVHAGDENLTIINWAYDGGLPMRKVIDILIEVNLNSSRIDPRVR